MEDAKKTGQAKDQYETPVTESHNPLEIMSKYEDKSSELPGI